jgi:hypothetical protein
MTPLYNRPFKIGFVMTIAVFSILNVISYARANWKETRTDGINLVADHYLKGPNWGFPFHWWGYSDWMFEDGFLGLVLNFLVIIAAAFLVGLLFRGVHNRGLSKSSL